MKLTKYVFYDRLDNSEVDIVCKDFDVALLLYYEMFDALFVVEKIDDCRDNVFYDIPTVYVIGESYLEECFL